MSDPGAGAAAPVRIGISSCFFHPDDSRPIFKGKTLLYVEQSMVRWVQRGGALVYPVPTIGDDSGVDATGLAHRLLDDYVADLDGLLLHGGSDVCPRTYGEEPRRPEWDGDEVRDRYELALIDAFARAGKPILGICRGAQILNVAHGGTLLQDITEQRPDAGEHRSQERYDRNLHEVDLVAGGGLAALWPGVATALVNSIHHQAIDEVGTGLAVEARSRPDGIVEAVRLTDAGRWAVGVQWHPEFFDGVDDGTMLDNDPLRDEFLAACERRRGT
jgi:putative glutamine amidotransferase